MVSIRQGMYLIGSTVLASVLVATGCQGPATNTTVATNSTNVSSNTNFNSNTNTNATSSTSITTSEPNEYQANIKLTLETMGEAQKATLPTLGAMVARSGADRVMEFIMPGTNDKVIYLEKAGMNYVILPNRKQYAELTKEALGFEVRRLLMPEQIVAQVKAIPGVRLVGEETTNGRSVVKYAYSGTANTQTQAGNVTTESYVLVDKETSLPVRSETVSQSQSGANVQGVSGVRMVTEMTDIKTTPDPSLFTLPTDYAKIDPEQVKAQANLIFNAVAALAGQAIKQAQAPAGSPSPMTSPAR
ncbi:MAG TPA: hypothetical protein VJV05_14240 [Pyrinomonadaceae bacterium]|nr:hypothetical protein [Pyrinomonadaceae bacterium]